MSSDASVGVGRARLGVVTNDFPPTIGGIQTYILALLEALDPTEVVVIAPSRAGAAACDAGFDFEVVRIDAPGGVLIPLPRVARKVASLMRARDVDIVGLTSLMPLGPLGREVARLLDKPLFVWHHGAELASSARIPIVRSLLKRVGSATSIHFVVSHWTERMAREAFGPRADIRLMRFGIDPDRWRPVTLSADEKRSLRARLGILQTDADPLVLSLGRLVKRKGNDSLIGAMILMTSRYSETALVIAGKGPDRKRLEGLVDKAGLRERVQFLGEVASEDIPDLYRSADIFAAPIRTRFFGLEGEGLGITIVEAAACGLPVVVGRSGGTPEAVIDGTTGFIVDGSDSYELAAALGRLARDRDLRSSMGMRGREYVTSEFSRIRMVAEFRKAARDVLAKAQ